jgi:hypothetical protein
LGHGIKLNCGFDSSAPARETVETRIAAMSQDLKMFIEGKFYRKA